MKLKIYTFMLFCTMVCTYSLNAQTWEKIDMHFPQGDTLLSNSTISFATKNTGWILTNGNTDNNIPPTNYSTKILKTVDGGNSWLLQKYIGNFFDTFSIYIFDSLHCWAIDGIGNLTSHQMVVLIGMHLFSLEKKENTLPCCSFSIHKMV